MLTAAMNDTKWDELRLAMSSLAPVPAWTTLSINGYRSQPDREWFYHFKADGYRDILHLEIRAENSNHRKLIHSALRKIHVPAEETHEGFRVFGYLQKGQAADFI